MKRKKIVFAFVLFFLFISNINASSLEGFITGNTVRFREGPGTNYPIIRNLYSSQNHSLVMENKDLFTGDGCVSGWYKGLFEDEVGYVCSSYVEFRTPYVPKDPKQFATYKEYLIAEGFDQPGYADLLATLHDEFPLWEFIPVITNLKFQDIVNAQSVGGKNCTYSSDQGLYAVNTYSFDYLKDEFIEIDVGCKQTNPETNAYYLDPRNWLSEKNIFMFESLEYNSESHTKDLVSYILSGNNNLKGYIEEFYQAAKQTMSGTERSISPLHLATRSRVEIGNKTAGYYRVSGTYPYRYCDKVLTGYYNFYNIGSYMDSCCPNRTPSARGMAYACGPACGFESTYGRPWNTAQKGINGGAQFLITKYFDKGQNTIYFQKFNTSGFTTPHTNQYMQNIAAPLSEGSTIYNAYKNKDKLKNRKIIFRIPIYLDMPLETKLPTSGNPNNHLKDLKINGNTVPNFSHDVNEYTVVLPINTTSVLVDASIINAYTKVSGIGQINISKSNPVINVVVTAQNKSVNTYKINLEFIEANVGEIINLTPTEIITKSNLVSDGKYILNLKEGSSVNDITNRILKVNNYLKVEVKDKKGNIKATSVATGDKLIMNNNGSLTELELVVIGDGSGDGVVTIADLLLVQKYILKYNNLQGPYLKAIDVNNDNKISIVDLLLVQKYILNLIEF